MDQPPNTTGERKSVLWSDKTGGHAKAKRMVARLAVVCAFSAIAALAGTANAWGDHGGKSSAVVAPGLDGIMLPKVESANDIVVLDHYLAALEQREGVASGSIRIIPVATETPRAMFTLDTYRGTSSRLLGPPSS